MTTTILTVRKANGTEVPQALEISRRSLEMLRPVFKLDDLALVGVDDVLTLCHVYNGFIRHQDKTFASLFVNNIKPATRAIVLRGSFCSGEKLTVTDVRTV